MAEVFAFYRDFGNLPRFLGGVMAVEPLAPSVPVDDPGPVGIRLHWTVETTGIRDNALICYPTKAPRGLRTGWEIGFAQGAHPGQTRVREQMSAPFSGTGRAVLAVMGKPPLEVQANLRRLKEITETERVTHTAYSVPGKLA